MQAEMRRLSRDGHVYNYDVTSHPTKDNSVSASLVCFLYLQEIKNRVMAVTPGFTTTVCAIK